MTFTVTTWNVENFTSASPAFAHKLLHLQETLATVINAHLKSKLLTFPGGRFSTQDETLRADAAYFAFHRRAAEVRTLRAHVTDLLTAQHDVIVLGDFNDGPDAATTQVLYGPAGDQPKGPEDVTNARSAFQRNDTEDPQRLFNVTKLAPVPIRWSRIHESQKELLDQIMASAGLMPRGGAGELRQVPEIDIRHGDATMAPAKPRLDGAVPDHAPVTARFWIMSMSNVRALVS